MHTSPIKALKPRMGSIVLKFDAEAGILHVRSAGLLEPRQIDQCFSEAGSIATTVRSNGDAMRVLVDAREATIQSGATEERMRVGTDALYLPCDRVAMLVKSSLVKNQLRRIVDKATHQMFLSENAALTWLLAYDGAVRSKKDKNDVDA